MTGGISEAAAAAAAATAAYSYWPTDEPEDPGGSRDTRSWGGRQRDNNGTRHLDGTRDVSHTQTARGKIHPLVWNKEESFDILFLQQRVLLPRVTHLELVVQIIDELLGFLGHVNPTVKWDNKWWSRNSLLVLVARLFHVLLYTCSVPAGAENTVEDI